MNRTLKQTRRWSLVCLLAFEIMAVAYLILYVVGSVVSIDRGDL